jgi:hypothetical protein
VSDYHACVQVKYEHAASTGASPSELSQLAADNDAAIDEVNELRRVYEERIGPIMDLAR